MKTARKKTKKAVAKPKGRSVKEKAAEGPRGLSIPMFDCKGKEIGALPLDQALFTGEVNREALYQAVLMYDANRRRGTASTKTRGDVSGGGKKPWRQKGTGRARAGSTRSPLWRHGGVIFGPHPRDFHYDIPKKVKQLAFLSSMNSKVAEKKLIGLDSLKIDEPKTKKFAAILAALKLEGKSLFVVDSIDENIRRSSRNIENLEVRNYKDLNTMDVLRSDTVVISKAALEKLPERIKA